MRRLATLRRLVGGHGLWTLLVVLLASLVPSCSSNKSSPTSPTSPTTGPRIQLSATALTFAATTGGADPSRQSVCVGNCGTGSLVGLSLSIHYAYGQPQGWLTAALGTGSAPDTVSVHASTGTLAVGTYSATISIGSGVADNSPQNLAVTFNVGSVNSPLILFSPNALAFSATAGGASPAAQTVSISSSSTTTITGLSASVSYTSGQPTGWLSASLNTTITPATLTVSAATGSLAGGTYTASIAVSSVIASNSPQFIPVTFTVAGTPQILLSSTVVGFSAVVGGANPSSQGVSVTNYGGGSLTGLAAAVSYASGQPTGWLSASLNTTTAPATLTLSPSTGSLVAGTYTATVAISSPVATNSPQGLTVTFTVGSAPRIQLSPTSLAFSAPTGGASPGSQSVSITNSGGGSLTGLARTVAYATGQPTGWLSTSLSSTTAPATLTVGATTGSLAAGTYSATVAVGSAVAGNSPQSVAVSFTVGSPPQIQLAPTSLAFSAVTGGASPSGQNVSITNSGGGSLTGLARTVAYATGQPTGWLSASLGTTTAPATLSVSAATGSLAAGTYVATIAISSAVAGNSPQSVEVSFAVTIAVPASPSGGTASAYSGTAIDLAWTDNSSNETGFRIYRGATAATATTLVATVGAGVTTYRDAGLSPGSPYYYRIYAYNAAGNSTGYASATATTMNRPVAPVLTVPATATGSFTVSMTYSWPSLASSQDHYELEESQSATSGFTLIASSSYGSHLSPYTVPLTRSAGTYYYRSRVYVGTGPSTGWSDYSATKSIVVSAAASKTRFVNNTSFAIVSLVVDGAEQFPIAPDGISSGAYYEMNLAPGSHTVWAANGWWDGYSRSEMYTWTGPFTQSSGVTGTVTYTDPTLDQILSHFSSSAYWSGYYWNGLQPGTAAYRFYPNGTYTFYNNGVSQGTGSYTPVSHNTTDHTYTFNDGTYLGTYYELLGEFTVNNGPPGWTKISYDYVGSSPAGADATRPVQRPLMNAVIRGGK